MNRRDFFKRCLAIAGAMLLPPSKVIGIQLHPAVQRFLDASPVTTVRWEETGGFNRNFSMQYYKSMIDEMIKRGILPEASYTIKLGDDEIKG